MITTRFMCLLLSLLMANAGISSYAQGKTEDFESFLSNFTSSAAFQYSRIKFPLASPIILLDDDESEKTFPFTKDKWQLLDVDVFVVNRAYNEEAENFYVSKYVQDDPGRKEFEAGYEESEVDLRVVFELIDGEWYVTDCYNSWYSFDLPAGDLEETVLQVKEENEFFVQENP